MLKTPTTLLDDHYENLFFPFNNLAGHHEDQLTRALIVLIKLVPAVEALFLDTIRNSQNTHKNRTAKFPLPEILGSTSRRRLATQAGDKIWESAGDTRKLISVLITDEKRHFSSEVEKSTRGARYDAVFFYEPDLAIVVENKPLAKNVWEEQLNPNVGDLEIEVDPLPVVVVWSDIIQGINDLYLRGFFEGTDWRIVQDFLAFVQKTNPELYPFRNLAACSRVKEAVIKRCWAILGEIGDGVEPRPHPGWKTYLPVEGAATMVALDVVPVSDDGSGNLKIRLELFPGDTMSQAREFFAAVDNERFLNLKKAGFQLVPNLHFAYMAKNLVWLTSRLPVEKFAEYWKSNRESIRQVLRSETSFQEYFASLCENGLASETDLSEYDRTLTNTKRDRFNVCPGFGVFYSWSIEEAEKLDVDGKFAEQVKARAIEAMGSWAQSFLPVFSKEKA